MTPVLTFAGRSVALFGLGGSGLATARALQAGGADVSAWDDQPASRERAIAAGIHVVDLAQADWSSFCALILSPGVPLTHPEPHWTAKKAKAHGIEIIGDIELFCRERNAHAPSAPFVAITGTNGKSTTTALIAHLLRHAGRDVAMGGNIGTAILDLEPPSSTRVHVVEISTFQIDLTPSLNPSIGILLNLTPDHLDRHGNMENYAAIKERLVSNASTALIGVDDDWCTAIYQREVAKRLASGAEAPLAVSVCSKVLAGIWADNGRILASTDAATSKMLADVKGIPTLRGLHNHQNAAFAVGAVTALGLSAQEIAEGLSSFPGLAHRMEIVRQTGKTLFVNDSKATNADAAQQALRAFDTIFWIAGGRAKSGGIEPLKTLFPKIAKAFLIGESAPDFAASLEGHVPYEICGTLDKAVQQAAVAASHSGMAEPVVLLSPACASYDQYANFEQRGRHFCALVQDLAEN